MSYTKLVKQWEKEHKKKIKEEQKQQKIKKELEEKRKKEIYIAKDISEKKEKMAAEQEQRKIIKIKDHILTELGKNNPFNYSQFLIIWDILTNNYNQIESDLNNKKITVSDIEKVINYIEKFSSEIIDKYWKENLLNKAM